MKITVTLDLQTGQPSFQLDGDSIDALSIAELNKLKKNLHNMKCEFAKLYDYAAHRADFIKDTRDPQLQVNEIRCQKIYQNLTPELRFKRIFF